MSSTEVNFLKDQVERLNALLGKYQEQYSIPLPEESGGEKKPWLTDKELISPLMQEYDVILQELQKDSDQYKSQVLNFRQQLEELVTENDRLRTDLKDVLGHQVEAGGSIPSASTSAASALANLQNQLKLAVEEKEACQQKWREVTQELDRVEVEMQSLKDSHNWKSVEQKAQNIRDQYAQSVTVLNAEMETLQSDLRQARQELGDSMRQIAELKKTNYTLQQQLAQREDERAHGLLKEDIVDSRLAESHRVMEELQQRVVNTNHELEESRRDQSVIETRLADTLRRLADTERRETEAVQQVRQAITLAETSVLEKDQAEVELRHKEEEVAELHDSLARLIDEAGARTRQEVDYVRKQTNDRVTKLTEELHSVEMNSTEKQSQLDRLLREKRALESELHKISREGKLEGSRNKESLEELSRRVSEAERGRDDLLMRVETLTQALAKERDESQQVKDSFAIKLQTLHERLASVQQEFDNANDDRLQHVNSINVLTQKLQQAEQERDSVQRKFLKELALIEQDQQTKVRGFEVQLQSTEDARRTSVAELRKLLSAQQRMGARWKEECQSITHKFEGKVAELRSEVTNLRQRNEQLTTLLKDSQLKTAEAEKLMGEYTRNIRRMESRMHKAESQASDIAKKMSLHRSKHRQLASERETLVNELSRSLRDKSILGPVTGDSFSRSAPLNLNDHQGSR